MRCGHSGINSSPDGGKYYTMLSHSTMRGDNMAFSKLFLTLVNTDDYKVTAKGHHIGLPAYHHKTLQQRNFHPHHRSTQCKTHTCYKKVMSKVMSCAIMVLLQLKHSSEALQQFHCKLEMMGCVAT